MHQVVVRIKWVCVYKMLKIVPATLCNNVVMAITVIIWYILFKNMKWDYTAHVSDWFFHVSYRSLSYWYILMILWCSCTIINLSLLLLMMGISLVFRVFFLFLVLKFVVPFLGHNVYFSRMESYKQNCSIEGYVNKKLKNLTIVFNIQELCFLPLLPPLLVVVSCFMTNILPWILP